MAAGSSSSTAFHLPKLALGRVCVDGADGVGGGRQWTRSGLCAVTATASLLCCVSPPSLPRRHLAASVQPPAAPHYVLCQAPSYSMLLTDLPAVTISGFEASHNGRNIWVKIWYITYMFIFNFDFCCYYPLCLKLGQSPLIYVCIWKFMFSILLKRAVRKNKNFFLKMTEIPWLM